MCSDHSAEVRGRATVVVVVVMHKHKTHHSKCIVKNIVKDPRTLCQFYVTIKHHNIPTLYRK